jgi:alkylated DNA repair dioxygenase AlkB
MKTTSAPAKAVKTVRRAKKTSPKPVPPSTHPLFVVSHFANQPLLDACVEATKDLLAHRPPVPTRNGVMGCQNRDVGFFSDVVDAYHYSGQTMPAQPMPGCLAELLADVNAEHGQDFNAILVNRYRDGNDYISAHSDNENLGSGGSVVALSWGATRKLRFKDKHTNVTVADVPLTSGSCLRMLAGCQEVLTHGVPQELTVKEPRVSFTFRRHA